MHFPRCISKMHFQDAFPRYIFQLLLENWRNSERVSGCIFKMHFPRCFSKMHVQDAFSKRIFQDAFPRRNIIHLQLENWRNSERDLRCIFKMLFPRCISKMHFQDEFSKQYQTKFETSQRMKKFAKIKLKFKFYLKYKSSTKKFQT